MKWIHPFFTIQELREWGCVKFEASSITDDEDDDNDDDSVNDDGEDDGDNDVDGCR